MLSQSSGPYRWVGFVEAILGFINKSLTVLAALLLVLIAALIAADVAGRGILNKPIIGVAEMVANSLVIIAFLQLPFTVRSGGMLRTEIMDIVGTPLLKRCLWLIGYLLGAFFFATIAWAEWGNMITSYINKEFEGHISFAVPVFPSRLAIVTGSILAALTYLLMCIHTVGALLTGNEEPFKPSEVQHG